MRTTLHAMLAALALAGALQVHAAEVAGVRFDERASVAGRELALNGAGLRSKLVFKVYAVGLYLPEKKKAVADILAQPGPRRVQIAILRDLSSDDFGKAFMDGLNANTPQSERGKLLPQTMKFGEMFAQIPTLKKGDVLLVDFVPGEGTVCQLNGRKIGESVPDVAFYNAILRIWLGDRPADGSLKPALLGAQ